MSTKVLFTAATKFASGESKQPRVGRLEYTTEIANRLRADGIDAVQRSVRPGENLSHFDAIWVAIGSGPTARGADHAPAALWALSQGVKHDLPTVCFLDDWQIHRLVQGTRSFHRTGERQLKKLDFYCNQDAAIANADPILDTARQFIDPRSRLWQHTRLVMPAFGWGNPAILSWEFLGLPVVTLDPTVLIAPAAAGIVPSPMRKRAWILAALTREANAWADEQQLDWPVLRFGWRSAKPKQPKLHDERAVAEMYAEHWGVVCSSYPRIAGSGWGRPRIVAAALTGAVLLADPIEARAMGEAYCVTPRQVERMSDAELRALAAAQRAAITPRLQWDERVLLDQVRALLGLAPSARVAAAD